MSLHFAPVPAVPSQPHAHVGRTSHRAATTNMGMAAWSLLGTWPLAIVAMIYASSAKTKFLEGDNSGGHKAAARAKGWAIASWCTTAVLLVFILSVG